MTSNEEMMHFGMWVYKTQSLKRSEKSPPVFSNWKRYFMWFNKGTLFYGENEGEPDKSIPVATCRGAERLAIEDFSKRKPPSLLSDFGWVLKTVEKTMVFVSDSDSQRSIWVEGINGMLPRGHQRSVSGYQSMFSDPMATSLNHPCNSSPSGNYSLEPITSHPVSPQTEQLAPSPFSRGPHQRTSSMGNYEPSNNFNTFGDGEGSPTRGFAQPPGGHNQRRRASYASGGMSGALVPTGFHASSNSGSLLGNNNGALTIFGDEGSPHRRGHSEQAPDHNADELVVMGTYVQKLRGDKGEKGSSKNWARKWMSMTGNTLWYGAEKNVKDTSIDISKCTSVERLMDEDMYSYRAPAEYYRFGLRLRAPGNKIWVFACETDLTAQGWYKVWKKVIPLSTEELAMAAQYTYESNLAQEHFLDEKHRSANVQRENEAKKKKEEQERVAHMTKMMAENLVKAAQAAEESKKRQRAEAEGAKQRDKAIEQDQNSQKAKELKQQEEFIAKEVAKRLAKERGEQLPVEEEILDPSDPDYAEKEIALRVKKAMIADQKRDDEKQKKLQEKEKKETDEQRARNAEKERLAQELRDLEEDQIAVHKEATAKKQDSGGCCVVM